MYLYLCAVHPWRHINCDFKPIQRLLVVVYAQNPSQRLWLSGGCNYYYIIITSYKVIIICVGRSGSPTQPWPLDYYIIYTGGIRIHAYLSVYTHFFFSFHICSIYNYTFTRAWLTRVFDKIRRNKIVYCLIRVILNSAHLHTIEDGDETRFCFLAQSHIIYIYIYKRKQFWDFF